jgi:putative membrane protein
MHTAGNRELLFLLGATVLALLVSGLQPYDRLTWFLEVLPVLIAIPLLALTRPAFALTRLVYWLIFLHALVLIVGGHYTYARVPLGFWVQEALDLARNHYDRFGHLMQGFAPAIIVREVLLRRSPLVRGKWLFFLVLCVCAFISVVYEFTEWLAALVSAEAADSFLGTQGDNWDTQWDLFLALCGATVSQLLLARLHDRQLRASVGGPS